MKTRRCLILVLAVMLVLPMVLSSCSGDFQVFVKASSTEERNGGAATTPIRGEDAGDRLDNKGNNSGMEGDAEPDVDPDTKQDTEQEIFPEFPDEPEIPSELPAPNYNYDFGLADFCILSADLGKISEEWGLGESQIISSMTTGRNEAVENQLNVVISVVTASRSDLSDKLQKDVLSGTSSYQMISAQASQMPDLAVKGLLSDLAGEVFDPLELYQPWWNSEFSRVARVGKVQRYAVGAADLSVYQNAYVTFFNTRIAETFDIKDQLYDLVFQDQWTFGNMLLFSDMIRVKSEYRIYGAVSIEQTVANGFLHGFDLSTIESNGNGTHTLVEPSERMIEAAEFLRLLWGTDTGRMYQDFNSALNLFASESSVFFVSTLDQALTLGSDGVSYGILPMPKYDGDQKDYRTGAAVGHSASAVPACGTVDQMKMTGVVLSLLNSLSYKADMPQTLFFYYANSELDSRILEMISESIVWDLSEIATSYLGVSPWRVALRNACLLIKPYDALKESYTAKLHNMLVSIQTGAKG